MNVEIVIANCRSLASNAEPIVPRINSGVVYCSSAVYPIINLVRHVGGRKGKIVIIREVEVHGIVKCKRASKKKKKKKKKNYV